MRLETGGGIPASNVEFLAKAVVNTLRTKKRGVEDTGRDGQRVLSSTKSSRKKTVT